MISFLAVMFFVVGTQELVIPIRNFIETIAERGGYPIGAVYFILGFIVLCVVVVIVSFVKTTRRR